MQLRTELRRDAGLSEDLTRRLVSALAGVDHLGTLLKVDSAVEGWVGAAKVAGRRAGDNPWLLLH